MTEESPERSEGPRLDAAPQGAAGPTASSVASSPVRDRFLSDFALSLVERSNLEDLLSSGVEQLRCLLDVDRAALLLCAPTDPELFFVRAKSAREGIEPFPEEYHALRLAPPLPRPLVEGRVLVADDAVAHPDLQNGQPLRARLGTKSLLLAPIHIGGVWRGIVSASMVAAPRCWNPDDIAFLESAVRHLGAAVKQLELTAELQRAVEDAGRAVREARLLEAATHSLLTRTASRDVLLRQMLEALVKEFEHENCSILVVDRETKVIREVAHHGAFPAVPSQGLRVDGPGLIAWAVRNKTAVSCPDVREDLRYTPGSPKTLSELTVPLVLDGEALGAFDLQSSRTSAFGEADRRLLSMFADRAAMALRLSDVVGELEERTRALTSIARATQLLNFRLNAPDVLTSFVEETSRAVPTADGCVAWVADAEGTTLTIAAAYGLGRATEAHHGHVAAPLEMLQCAGRSFRENRTVHLDTPGLDELMNGADVLVRARVRAAAEDAEVKHLLAVPIRVGEKRLGVIEVLSARARPFSRADVEMLELFAEQAAIALRNARIIDELVRGSRLKDDFLANLSHELRAPLAGIVGWSEVLLDGADRAPQTERAARSILEKADNLLRMLGDLVDLSRIDSHGLPIQRQDVSLAEVVGSAESSCAEGARKKGVAILCAVAPDLPLVKGDAARLYQLVLQLLGNAVKFSPPGAEVRLAARRTADAGVEFTVEDAGFGIDAPFLPHVFAPFRQEEASTNRRFGGLGIGLTIAKAIVAAHGGTIAARSEGKNRGSRFTVTFPSGICRTPWASLPSRDASPARPAAQVS